MTPKFKYVFLISLLTSIIALIASLTALPDNSGYFELFLLFISPVYLFIFTIWSYILIFTFSINNIFKNMITILLLSILFEYVIVLFVMLLLSSDLVDYGVNEFLSDATDAIKNKNIFFSVFTIAFCFSLLLKLVTRRNKTIIADKDLKIN